MPKGKHDWTKLDPLIDQLKGQGWNDTCNGPQTRSLGLANKGGFEPAIHANMRG
jgi:hypothetical protein